MIPLASSWASYTKQSLEHLWDPVAQITDHLAAGRPAPQVGTNDVVTEPNGNPAVEVSVGDHVVYASPTVRRWQQLRGGGPIDGWTRAHGKHEFETFWMMPDAGSQIAREVCEYSSPSEWSDSDWAEMINELGERVEQEVREEYGDGPSPFRYGMWVRTCLFVSDPLLAQISRTADGQALAGAIGVAAGGAALAMTGTAFVGARVDRFRRRLREANRSETPVLMDNPPGSVWSGITEEFNQSVSRAQLSIDQQRSFVADAAHELRSPLTSLITTLEVAERHPASRTALSTRFCRIRRKASR